MNNLLELYAKIIKAVGLTVEEDYSVTVNEKPVRVNKKPLILPSKKQLDNLTNEDGEVVKYIFNPLRESLTVKKEPSLVKLLNVSSLRFNAIIGDIGLLLLKSGLKDAEKDVPMEVAVFLSSLHKIKGNANVMIDDKTISLWENIIEQIIKNDLQPLKLNIKHGVVSEGEKWNSGIVISSPLLDSFEYNEPDVSQYTKRRKDKDVFSVLLKYLIGELLEEKVISISNDSNSADTISFMKAFRKIAKNMNEHLEVVKTINEEIVEANIVDVPYTDKDIASIHKMRSLVVSVPTITDNHVEHTEMVTNDKEIATDDEVPWETDAKPEKKGKEETNAERVRKAIYGNRNQYTNPPAPTPTYGNPQQPMYRRPNPNTQQQESYVDVFNNPIQITGRGPSGEPIFTNASGINVPIDKVRKINAGDGGYNNPQQPMYGQPNAAPTHNNPQQPMYGQPNAAPTYGNPQQPMYGQPAPGYNNPAPGYGNAGSPYGDPYRKPTVETPY